MATKRQQEIVQKLQEGAKWLSQCPVSDHRGADAINETFHTWFYNLLGEDQALNASYDEECDKGEHEDHTELFWASVLGRL